ncbi:N-acetyltransferase [Alginatibacterium sediminis]|uniref:N-acetyltransferase n=1 Tax=Alginatibacterium sediminis TaxID=2164068 RepID=A0A420EDB7_9ALTE|nr:GNAT family N-acetyltransferase [Alginatibacterium sediminis]RKF18661.1 N-acetyltransferase [Alginatibacterium sediminis]
MNIEFKQDDIAGAFFVAPWADDTAKLSFQKKSPTLWLVDHTFVPEQFRGQGVAALLVNALIEKSEQEGVKIIPLCSYVAKQFERHPQWQHLLAQAS